LGLLIHRNSTFDPGKKPARSKMTRLSREF
jgi:hypothetical protein